MITAEFYTFCIAHCCNESCKERKDYCPIADEARKKYGRNRTLAECQTMFYQQKEAQTNPFDTNLSANF